MAKYITPKHFNNKIEVERGKEVKGYAIWGFRINKAYFPIPYSLKNVDYTLFLLHYSINMLLFPP